MESKAKKSKKAKTLVELKLNQFRKVELEKRELNVLKGGCSCKCSYSDSSL
jgi:natural product precursor